MKPPYKVAYLGPAATFSHEAARLQFGMAADYLPCRSIPEVFMTTARHEADYGIVPVENAIEGGVTFTLDMFARPDPLLADLRVWAEVNLPIVQNLLVAMDGPTAPRQDRTDLLSPTGVGPVSAMAQRTRPAGPIARSPEYRSVGADGSL